MSQLFLGQGFALDRLLRNVITPAGAAMRDQEEERNENLEFCFTDYCNGEFVGLGTTLDGLTVAM
jgi:hypothetical protein